MRGISTSITQEQQRAGNILHRLSQEGVANASSISVYPHHLAEIVNPINSSFNSTWNVNIAEGATIMDKTMPDIVVVPVGARNPFVIVDVEYRVVWVAPGTSNVEKV
jgi:hypothetical protein